MAIAALARAAREQSGGDFDTSHYAEAARRGYLHLREHNLAYLDDGRENIIDDYCALLAAVELTQTPWPRLARGGKGQGRQALRPPAPPPRAWPLLECQRRRLAPLLSRRRGGSAGAGPAGIPGSRAGSGSPR